MRLGVVTSSWPQHVADPAGRFVQTHTRAFAQQNVFASVEVVAAGLRTEALRENAEAVHRVQSYGPLFAGEGAPEVWERTRGLMRFGLAVESARFTLAMSQQVRVRAAAWDHIHSHWLVPCSLAVTLANAGKPHLAFVHSGDVAALEQLPEGGRLARWILERVEKVVCVSDDLAKRLRGLVGAGWPKRLGCDVQAMPVDPTAFRVRTATERTRPGGVLGVGRLVPIKGFDLLILALGGLAARQRPALTLLGEGPERARLTQLAARVGLKLHMPGVVPAQEVASYMSRADVCVLPSRRLSSGRTEGLPLVALEALAVGTPLVATCTGGLTSISHHPLVTLVPPNQVTALRAAVEARLHPA